MTTIKDTIKQQINQVLDKKYDIKDIDFQIEYPPKPDMGDYSCNIAMLLAKKLKKDPIKLGQEIIDELAEQKMFYRIEIFKPGFINFYLTQESLEEELKKILKAKEKYGQIKADKKLKIQVEFISANPTGPLTLANGRGGFSGDILANLLELAGHKVEREYYVNDIGRQITILGHSILKDDQAEYKGEYIDKLAKEIKGTDPSQVGIDAAQIILEKHIKPSIKKMGVDFDNYFSELEMLKKLSADNMLLELRKKKLVYEKDGASWLKSADKDKGDDQDRVLVKSDGSKTYFLSDIAYHWNKFDKRKFDKVINLWGADHHGYVPRMMSAVELLGFKGQLEILLMQLVRLVKGGKEVRMSKRKGVYVTTDELIDKVGLDVTRFFFLMHANNKAMDFDLNLAKEKSSKNPVYYVQYAHARICSIIKKAKHPEKRLKLELETAEKELIKELIKWPELVREVVENYEVHKIPFYAVAVADKFHNFYEQCRVIEDNKSIEFRLNLIKATKQVLQNVLKILGVAAPEKM